MASEFKSTFEISHTTEIIKNNKPIIFYDLVLFIDLDIFTISEEFKFHKKELLSYHIQITIKKTRIP